MPYNREIIGLNDTVISAMLKMCEGNPGAMSVLAKVIRASSTIDPDALEILGPITPILNFDSFGIRGSRIWMLYKDVSKHNLSTMLGLMRAVQLGFLSLEKLDYAIDNYGEGLDIQDCSNKVKEYLPNFRLDVRDFDVQNSQLICA